MSYLCFTFEVEHRKGRVTYKYCSSNEGN